MTPAVVSGGLHTYATILVWDELTFNYASVVDLVRDRDATTEFLALHKPPLVIVLSVRCT
jgi:hypothetical protein